jgi:hypothetical protein
MINKVENNGTTGKGGIGLDLFKIIKKVDIKKLKNKIWTHLDPKLKIIEDSSSSPSEKIEKAEQLISSEE